MPSSYTPGGGTFSPASPGPIGGTTPAAGAFTTLDVFGLLNTYATIQVLNTGGTLAPMCATPNLTTNAIIHVRGDYGIGLFGGTSFPGSSDVILSRAAANTLALRNGTNAQVFQVYNTYTDDSNYEQAVIKWASNTLEIGVEALGTGTLRSVKLKLGPSPSQVINGVTYYPHDTAGTLTWTTTP